MTGRWSITRLIPCFEYRISVPLKTSKTLFCLLKNDIEIDPRFVIKIREFSKSEWIKICRESVAEATLLLNTLSYYLIFYNWKLVNHRSHATKLQTYRKICRKYDVQVDEKRVEIFKVLYSLSETFHANFAKATSKKHNLKYNCCSS